MATNYKITLDGNPSEAKTEETADFYAFLLDVLMEIQAEMDAEKASHEKEESEKKGDLTYDIQLLTEAVADLSYAASTLAEIVAKISDEA